MPPTSNTEAVDYKLYIPQDAKVLRIHSLVSEYSLLRTWNTESGLKLTGIDREKNYLSSLLRGQTQSTKLSKKKKSLIFRPLNTYMFIKQEFLYGIDVSFSFWNFVLMIHRTKWLLDDKIYFSPPPHFCAKNKRQLQKSKMKW